MSTEQELSAAVDKCRESFEQWCDDNGVFRARQPSGCSEFGVPFNPDKYRMASVQLAWEAAQAAWTASREELAKEQKADGLMLVRIVDGGTLEPRQFEHEGNDDAE